MHTKRLILRLSSLGDIILSSAALEVKSSSELETHWVVAQEFSGVIKNHPKINQLFEFNRKSGLKGWIKLCRQLWENQYTEIYDLHRSVRTRVMRVLFFYWGLFCKDERKACHWKVISKNRSSLWGLYLLKRRFFPSQLLPPPWTIKFAQAMGGAGTERPDLRHLLRGLKFSEELKSFQEKQHRPYICVMPSSRWDGKKWPVQSFVETLKELPYFPVILGTKSDLESIELCEKLSALGIPYFSGVGKWGLPETALVLAHSKGYLGVDTGLAHLSEAVRIPAQVIFGPTSPEMGFGPWMKESKAIQLDLGCRPCSKDGRYCYRPVQKYKCLNDLKSDQVVETLKDL
jgi:heptosyltransferase-2